MKLTGDPVDVFKDVARMIGELLDVRVVCLSEIRGSDSFRDDLLVGFGLALRTQKTLLPVGEQGSEKAYFLAIFRANLCPSSGCGYRPQSGSHSA